MQDRADTGVVEKMSIKFHLPDFWGHGPLNLALIDMVKEHPEYFRDGVEIASVYGCFPPAVWNGGRNINGFAYENAINHVLHEFNSRGIPLRFTFTNPLLTKENMADPFCNRIVQLADNGLNEAIVNTQVMEDYLRANYPSYKLTSSTCKQIRELEPLIAELERDYSLVVLDYNWNNDFDKLDKIPEKYRSRIEVLVCPYCFPDCKRRGEHYRFLGDQQIKRSTINSFGRIGGVNPLNVHTEEEFRCEAISRNFLETVEFSTHITPDTLYEKYVPMGFEHFKIEGRTIHPLNVIESYVYYMAKPEFKDMIRLKLGLEAFKIR